METRYNIVRSVALLQPRTGLWGCSKDGNWEKNHAQKRRKKDASKDDKQVPKKIILRSPYDRIRMCHLTDTFRVCHLSGTF